MPLIEVRDLRIEFDVDGRRSVPVRRVSFAIPRGGRVALVGESGCGKSLTAMAIGGLVERARITGEVIGGCTIAYVFQNPMLSLDPVMRIGRQIEEGRSRSAPSVVELLSAVELDAAVARKYPCQLSGGQQQRVMIAMAIARQPELIIADEPTTALDVTTQREMLDLMMKVADKHRTAVLLITHNLALVAQYAQTVNVMYAGEIVEHGDAAEVLSSPRHPYTQMLLKAVPRLDAPKDAPLADIPGTVPPPTDWPQGCAFHPRCPYSRPECSRPDFTVCPQML